MDAKEFSNLGVLVRRFWWAGLIVIAGLVFLCGFTSVGEPVRTLFSSLQHGEVPTEPAGTSPVIDAPTDLPIAATEPTRPGTETSTPTDRPTTQPPTDTATPVVASGGTNPPTATSTDCAERYYCSKDPSQKGTLIHEKPDCTVELLPGNPQCAGDLGGGNNYTPAPGCGSCGDGGIVDYNVDCVASCSTCPCGQCYVKWYILDACNHICGQSEGCK